MPAGGGFSVIVAPSSPSRIAPPSVSVKSPPGQGAEILSVKWLVNGAERESGRTLSPSGFLRGDRIQAIVKMRAGADEKILTTPEVVAVNALPAVTDVRIEPQAPTNGSTVRAVVQAQDPDGDPLSFKYQWFVDNVAVPGGDSMALKGVKKGSWVHVAVIPNDGFADGAWKFSPRYQVVNAPPVVKSTSPTSIPPSRVLTHTIVAEDPDGDPLTYTLVKGPEGLTLSGATLTWKVTDRDTQVLTIPFNSARSSAILITAPTLSRIGTPSISRIPEFTRTIVRILQLGTRIPAPLLIAFFASFLTALIIGAGVLMPSRSSSILASKHPVGTNRSDNPYLFTLSSRALNNAVLGESSENLGASR